MAHSCDAADWSGAAETATFRCTRCGFLEVAEEFLLRVILRSDPWCPNCGASRGAAGLPTPDTGSAKAV